MLKIKILKNIGIIISVLLIIQILFIFPEKQQYTSKYETNTSVIYLFDDNNYVARVNIATKSDTKEKLVEELVSLLTVNNTDYRLRNGFKAPIPLNTKLLGMKLDDDVLTLNFSREIFNIDANMEEKMYEAIIYTFTSIKGINKIKIKVENKILDKFHYKDEFLPELLDRSFKINKEYDTYSLNDTKEITIFYPAIMDDYFYYVPVTKYTDKNKEKIEIIIDELKSSSTYNTNLISYINEETELINYELLDKSLILNFTDSIFTGLTNNYIKEEVTYAINSSIKESYNNVDNVMYYINNNIWENYFLLLG